MPVIKGVNATVYHQGEMKQVRRPFGRYSHEPRPICGAKSKFWSDSFDPSEKVTCERCLKMSQRKPGRPKLENKKVSVTVHLDPDVADTIKQTAKRRDESVSSVVNSILAEAVS